MRQMPRRTRASTLQAVNKLRLGRPVAESRCSRSGNLHEKEYLTIVSCAGHNPMTRLPLPGHHMHGCRSTCQAACVRIRARQ